MSSNNSSRAPTLSLQTTFSCDEISCKYYSKQASSACGSLACRTEAASDAAWGLAWDMGDANVSSQKTDGTREPPPTPAQGGNSLTHKVFRRYEWIIPGYGGEIK